MVSVIRLELIRYFYQRILSPLRLPFRATFCVLEKLPGVREKRPSKQQMHRKLQQQVPSGKPQKYNVERPHGATSRYRKSAAE